MNAVIEKIQKLLSLATSPNEHEAKAAAEKAQKLLIQHNITMSQVEGYESDFKNYGQESIVERSSMSIEDSFIAPLLTRHFFVTSIITRRRAEKRSSLSLLGEKTNIEIAKYVRVFLLGSYKSLYAQWRKENPDVSIGRSRKAYYAGLTSGIDHQLKEQKRKVESETGNALMIIKNKLQMYQDKELGNIKSKAAPKIHGVEAALDAGYVAGKNLRISKGITHEDGSKGNQLAHFGEK